MPKYIIAIGSSHFDGTNYLKTAINIIKDHKYINLDGQSRIFINPAKDTSFNFRFYNCALAISTILNVVCLFRETQSIEQKLGRIRPYPYAPRTIDIDLLCGVHLTYQSENLSLPHRQAFSRMYFLLPAKEAVSNAKWPPMIDLKYYSNHIGEKLFAL